MDSSDFARVRSLAWAEINSLLAIGVLPETFEGGRIGPSATPIYDVNGEELYYRVPLAGPNGEVGYADVTGNPALGEPLLAFTTGSAWDEAQIREAACAAARELCEKDVWDLDMRLVAYSHPKLAAQFLDSGEEIIMLELYSWEPVPEIIQRDTDEPPGNFERWSFLDKLPDEERKQRTKQFEERADRWLTRVQRDGTDERLDLISHAVLEAAGWISSSIIKIGNTRELHFTTRNGDHIPCFELRGQVTSVWCVAASVQMVLDFYRYEYSQVRIAQQLGLGTLSSPSGLPYSRDGDVVTALEALSSSALTSSMTTSPNWSEFKTEITANRPLISFVPGHSRAVAGYYESFLAPIGQTPFKGLLVYDPWPPNAGVITRWENFNTTTYRRTFTARITRV
jgi:hypothetical protein